MLAINKYFASDFKEIAHVLKKLKVLNKKYQQLFRDVDVIDWVLTFAIFDLLDFKSSSQDFTDENFFFSHALSYCFNSIVCYTPDYTSVIIIDITVSVSQTDHRKEKNFQSYFLVTVFAAFAVFSTLRDCSFMRLIRKWFRWD